MKDSALLAGVHHRPPVVVDEFITRGSRKEDFSEITIIMPQVTRGRSLETWKAALFVGSVEVCTVQSGWLHWRQLQTEALCAHKLESWERLRPVWSGGAVFCLSSQSAARHSHTKRSPSCLFGTCVLENIFY